MRLSLLSALIAFVFAGTAPGVFATVPADTTTFRLHDESEMTVHGSSNVRDWTMDVESFDGHVMFNTEQRGTPSIYSLAVEVPVEALVADRSSMQEKAHKALKKEEYPTVQFRSDSVTVATAASDSFAVIANGDLTIAGETRAVTLRAKGAPRGEGGYHVRGEHELTLSAFNVERPSALLGALTVSDGIRLTFDVILQAQ